MTLQKSSKRQKLNDYPLTISQTNINTYTRSFYGLICQLVSNDLSIIEHVIVRTHKLQYIYTKARPASERENAQSRPEVCNSIC